MEREMGPLAQLSKGKGARNKLAPIDEQCARLALFARLLSFPVRTRQKSSRRTAHWQMVLLFMALLHAILFPMLTAGVILPSS